MNNENFTRVVVTDIKMPFWSMVRFMVKWAIAAIPALIFLTVIGAGISALVTGLMTHSTGKVVDAAELHPIVGAREV